MADTKVSDDPAAGAVQMTDDIPLVRAGGNYRASPQAIAAGARGTLKDDGDDGYKAVSGDDILADTSGASFTVNVPDDGEVGMWFRITDATDSFATNPLTIGKNSQTVHGEDEDMTISTNGVTVEFMHNGETWKIRGLPLA